MMARAVDRMRSGLNRGVLGRGMWVDLTLFGFSGGPVDLTLSDEHRQLRELARRFTDERIVPNATRWDREEAIDKELVPALGEVGFLGLGIDEEHGGSGGDNLAYCLVLEEVARGDSAVRGIISVSLGLVAKSIAKHGTEEQKQRWLPGLTAGTQIACFA